MYGVVEIEHRSIWIGFEPREADAFAVCKFSLSSHISQPIPMRGLVLSDLQRRGLYTRPVEKRKLPKGFQLWDPISCAPMSTEFAISRFLTPILAKALWPKPRVDAGWALFMDCDIMARANVLELFALADPRYAVMCVKHQHNPQEAVKMDGVAQVQYARKNWSSVMLFNVEHPANKALTVELINTVPGRDLHRFCWLDDELIGELPVEWNYLVGHSPEIGWDDNGNAKTIKPKLVHFTDGVPTMPGYENVDYAEEFFNQLVAWAS